MPQAPPSNPRQVQMASVYTSTSKVRRYGREPTYNEILRDFPPVESYWEPSDSATQVFAITKVDTKECNWAEIEAVYLIGYLWVPEGARSIQLNAGADDRGYLYINGRHVLTRSCCSMSYSQINVGNFIETGSWNLIFGADADG